MIPREQSGAPDWPVEGHPMAKALTAAGVEKAKANPDKRREIPDGLLAGLYLIVQPVSKAHAGPLSHSRIAGGARASEKGTAARAGGWRPRPRQED